MQKTIQKRTFYSLSTVVALMLVASVYFTKINTAEAYYQYIGWTSGVVYEYPSYYPHQPVVYTYSPVVYPTYPSYPSYPTYPNYPSYPSPSQTPRPYNPYPSYSGYGGGDYDGYSGNGGYNLGYNGYQYGSHSWR